MLFHELRSDFMRRRSPPEVKEKTMKTKAEFWRANMQKEGNEKKSKVGKGLRESQNATVSVPLLRSATRSHSVHFPGESVPNDCLFSSTAAQPASTAHTDGRMSAAASLLKNDMFSDT